MQGNMVSVPLPILTAILCAVIALLMLRLDLGRKVAAVFFAILFADFALQSLLLGLRFGYGVEHFITFQRVLPLTVGPLLYLGFLSLALPSDQFRKQAVLHLGIAIGLAILLTLFANIYRDFDLVISVSYLIYIGLLVMCCWLTVSRQRHHLVFGPWDMLKASPEAHFSSFLMS